MGEASPRFGNGFARLGSPGVLKTTHTASAPLSRRTDSFLRDLIDSCIPIPLDEVEDPAHDRPAGPPYAPSVTMRPAVLSTMTGESR